MLRLLGKIAVMRGELCCEPMSPSTHVHIYISYIIVFVIKRYRPDQHFMWGVRKKHTTPCVPPLIRRLLVHGGG